MRNVFLISANTLRETLRQKLMILVALVALALVLSSKYLLSLDLGHEQLRFVFDFGSGALGFFGSIIAVVATCQIFHSELENKTVITLLSKPVGFAQFAAGKFLGAAAALALFAAVIAAATCLMLFITRAGFGEAAERLSAGLETNYAGVCAYAFAQWCKLCAVAAVASFVCSVSSSLLFSAVVSFMALAVSTAGEITLWLGGKTEGFAKIASYAFPDFNMFNALEKFAFAPVDCGAFAAAVAYAAIYSVAAVAAAAFAFSKREF